MCAEFKYIVGPATFSDSRAVVTSCGNLRHRIHYLLLFSGCIVAHGLACSTRVCVAFTEHGEMSLQCDRNKKRAILVFFAFIVCCSSLCAVDYVVQP